MLPENAPQKELWFKKIFPLLLLLALVVLVVLGVFFYYQSKVGSKVKYYSSVEFSNQAQQVQYVSFIKSGFGKGSGGFEDLNKAFVTLNFEYLTSPSSEKRERLLALSHYLLQKYPADVKKTDLTVPCREQSCGAVALYSTELADIRDRIDGSSLIGENDKKKMLFALESVAFAAGEGNGERERSSLSGVFFDLKRSWEKTGDEEIKKLAEDTVAVLKSIDSDKYKALFESKTYSLE